MNSQDCMMTRSGLLTRLTPSCSVATSHTEVHRCLISSNENYSASKTTTCRPTCRTRGCRSHLWGACWLYALDVNRILPNTTLLYRSTKTTFHNSAFAHHHVTFSSRASLYRPIESFGVLFTPTNFCIPLLGSGHASWSLSVRVRVWVRASLNFINYCFFISNIYYTNNFRPNLPLQ